MTAQETEYRRAFEEWYKQRQVALEIPNGGDAPTGFNAGWRAYHNTIGKDLADALEAAYKLIEVDYREADESTGEYIEKRARTTWENICAALTKYRGTKCVILES